MWKNLHHCAIGACRICTTANTADNHRRICVIANMAGNSCLCRLCSSVNTAGNRRICMTANTAGNRRRICATANTASDGGCRVCTCANMVRPAHR